MISCGTAPVGNHALEGKRDRAREREGEKGILITFPIITIVYNNKFLEALPEYSKHCLRLLIVALDDLRISS